MPFQPMSASPPAVLTAADRRSWMDARWRVLRSLVAHPRVLAAGPRLDLFLLRYMRKFRVREAGGRLILHSHLPPIDSPAYGKFIDEHLSRPNAGPAHAQIAITN